MRFFKSSTENEKRKYVRTFELALILSLVLHLCILHALPAIESNFWNANIKINDLKIEVKDVPKTVQRRKLPPPPNPFLPVPTESEAFPTNEILETIDLAITDIPLPPPPVKKGIYDEFIFIPHEEPPTPVGGMRVIHKYLRYPYKALSLGVEGMVILGILIDENGKAEKIQILKHSGQNVGFEQEALRAVKKIKWKPAKQRDRAVKVWLALPFRFELVMI